MVTDNPQVPKVVSYNKVRYIYQVNINTVWISIAVDGLLYYRTTLAKPVKIECWSACGGIWVESGKSKIGGTLSHAFPLTWLHHFLGLNHLMRLILYPFCSF